MTFRKEADESRCKTHIVTIQILPHSTPDFPLEGF